MTIFDNLSELKTQLFDAPNKVKESFNQICEYFDDRKIPTPTFRIIANIHNDTSFGAPPLSNSYEALSYKKLAEKDPSITIDRDGNVCKWSNFDASRFKTPDDQYKAMAAQNKEKEIKEITNYWKYDNKRSALNLAKQGISAFNKSDFSGSLAEAVEMLKTKSVDEVLRAIGWIHF